MVTIVMRDALRAQVERASQGRQTVLYTAKGQPSYMNVVPLVTLAALAWPAPRGRIPPSSSADASAASFSTAAMAG